MEKIEMFDLFKTKPYADDQLGELKWSGGYWKGTIPLGSHGDVEIRVSGNRKEPARESLVLARELGSRFESLVPQIQNSLFEHAEPYLEADRAGELVDGEEAVPEIPDAESVWPHVSVEHVLFESMEGITTVEIAFSVAWDDEHTVGARFQNWELIELCGSVL
jgi:hypothetical protein